MKERRKFYCNYIWCWILIYTSFVFPGCSDQAVVPEPSQIAEYTQIDFEPSWSPNASEVVYSHSNINHKFTGIYIVDSDGSGNHQIISDFARSPDWSPDNAWIAFSQFENIYKSNISGDSIAQITTEGKNYYPKWNNDNIRIAYSSTTNFSDYNIYVINSDGTGKTLIDLNGNYPDWINSSNSLIYFKPSRNPDGTQNGDTLVQYSITNHFSAPITLVNGDDHVSNSYPVYAGDIVIFCSMNRGGYIFIYKMNLDGSGIEQLTTTQGYAPDYSFSNQKIIYTNRDTGNGRLWTMNKNGSNKAQLTF